MWREIYLIWLLIAYAATIKVPVDYQETTTLIVNDTSPTPDAPIYYESESDEPKIDSYLIPPNTHSAEDKQDVIPTYLLPPTQDKQEDFYVVPTDGTQSDWYPIQSDPQNNPAILPQSLPQIHPSVLPELPPSQGFVLPHAQQDDIPIFMVGENHPRFEHARKGKAQQLQNQEIHVPSRHLEPPAEDAENHFILPTPSAELELPYQEQQQQFVAPSEEVYELPIKGPNHNFNPKNKPIKLRLEPAKPTLSLHLTPPKPLNKNPTRLYPKKYPGGFKPVPIPLTQFAEDSAAEVPKAKPAKPFNPVADPESEYSTPSDKDTYLYEKLKQKRKLRKEKAAKQQLPPLQEPANGPGVSEQETSETHFRYPGRNVYPAPLRQAPPTPPPRPLSGAAPSAPPPAGDRTEFRMHGMKGPHSYQFGYDTGKGKNRQFRFEERDNDGHVRGHYGYVDKHGKLRVVNYDADPKLGFRAEAPVESEP
ncbi:uncharacterized protein LOC125226296 [Leguminivora glycinivorella]|uniref:uncharacterized protein LOC125226296 n=1 Tax=Leguminivora glycinivorella TaxID=1035111 RepID=UPI00200FE4CD|nr:uncharacterized protein LOC125226296 [Leguminivora glycinivorella]